MKIKKTKSNKTKLTTYLLLSGLLVACGSDDDDNNDGAAREADPQVKDGVFVSSQVENIRYETDSQSGYTDEDGMFQYRDGETASFYIGDILLGTAQAKAVIDPTLLKGPNQSRMNANHMLRFLQSLDEDQNPENGITISEFSHTQAQGQNLSFSLSKAEFDVRAGALLDFLSANAAVLVTEKDNLIEFKVEDNSTDDNSDDDLESELEETEDTIEEGTEDTIDEIEDTTDDIGDSIEEGTENL